MSTILGQTIFTQPQIDLINQRIDGQLPPYYNSGNGFYGDGAHMMAAAASFLSEEQGAGYVNEWDWLTHPIDINQIAVNLTKTPSPGVNTAGGSGNSGSTDIERIHDAAVLSLVWKGLNDTVTFNGVSQSKDLHSKDLAEAVFAVLSRRAADPNLDWADRVKFPISGALAAHPYFISFAKMTKYLNSYSCIYDQLSGTPNYALVEDWIQDAAEFAYLLFGQLFTNLYGAANAYPPFADNSINTASGVYPNTFYTGQPNTQPYTWYTSTNVGVNAVTWLQAGGLNNRVWDAASLIGTCGIVFDNQTYMDFEFELFKLYFELGVFPDGTFNEFYRSYAGVPGTGLGYASVTVFHLAGCAYRHAAAVTNGFTNVGTDKGKYFDYTTARGSDEICSNYIGTTTSGGTKGLLALMLNMANYYRSSANGGWNDIRFAEGPTAIDEENRPYTLPYAYANIYYQNQTIEDFYKGLNGFTTPNYYSNGFTIANNGAWGEHSHGPWGTAVAYGRYLGVADMEGIAFAEVEEKKDVFKRRPLMT